MKPAPFEYLRPATLAEACAALASSPDARIIAGGQTLLPMLAMRLSRPSLLVDVGRLDELRQIRADGDEVCIGSAVRQAEALRSPDLARNVPLLAKALPNVGHPPTRERGTIGGSVAHADPSAEIALVVATLDARIVYRTVDGEEEFEPEDFFFGPMITAAPDGGCLTEIRFPTRPAGRVGTGFHEVASRRGDYAFASAAAQIVLDDAGTCVEARLGIGAVGDAPIKLELEAEGSGLADADIADLVAAAMDDIETVEDLHATSAHRRRAAGELARRALREARDEALEAAT